MFCGELGSRDTISFLESWRGPMRRFWEVVSFNASMRAFCQMDTRSFCNYDLSSILSSVTFVGHLFLLGLFFVCPCIFFLCPFVFFHLSQLKLGFSPENERGKEKKERKRESNNSSPLPLCHFSFLLYLSYLGFLSIILSSRFFNSLF